MTTSTARRDKKGGFTLAELVVALAILSIVLASMYPAIIQIAQGAESVVNYTEMNTLTRNAIERFGRDARMAQHIKLATDHRIILDVQGVDVEYRFYPDVGAFYREVNSNQQLLFTDSQDLQFSFYDLRQNPTSDINEVKHVQLEAVLQRQVLQLFNTNYIISARFMMRNRRVSD